MPVLACPYHPPATRGNQGTSPLHLARHLESRWIQMHPDGGEGGAVTDVHCVLQRCLITLKPLSPGVPPPPSDLLTLLLLFRGLSPSVPRGPSPSLASVLVHLSLMPPSPMINAPSPQSGITPPYHVTDRSETGDARKPEGRTLAFPPLPRLPAPCCTSPPGTS